MSARTPRRRGRPAETAPSKKFADKTYIQTAFRLRKETVAEADTIDDLLSLGSRTAAVQYAVRKAFRELVRQEGEGARQQMARRLRKLGVGPR